MIEMETTVKSIVIFVFNVSQQRLPDVIEKSLKLISPLKVAIVDFQYAYTPSYAIATIVRDNRHERKSKCSLLWQIMEELLRQKRVDSALRK